MKRFILAALAAVCVVACQKDGGGGVVVRQTIDVTIKADGVLSGFTLYNATDLHISGKKVKVSYFLYDPSGNLSNSGNFQLDGFSGEETVSFTVTGTQNYTLVALAHIAGSESDPAFAISDYSTLEGLTVQQKDFEGQGEDVLGYAAVTVNPVSSSQTVKLQPANSLVYLSWEMIHSGDGDAEYPLYGDYLGKATDVWGNTYEWTITVEKGASANEVIIKNLSPYFVKAGYSYSSKSNVNIFTGTYDAVNGTITLPQGQSTGMVISDTEASVNLYGGREDGDYIYFEDLLLNVGNGTLTTVNMLGTCAPGGDGWFDLFEPGIVFNSQETPQGMGKVDKYYTIFHSNDVMRFNGTTPVFSSTLGEVNNYGISLDPSRYPSYDYIYNLTFLFPGSFYTFGRAFSGSDKLDTPKVNVDVQANKQYVYTFDCANLLMLVREGSYAGTKLPVSYGMKKNRPSILHECSIPRATGIPVLAPER